MQHIRKVEWNSYLNDSNDENRIIIPKKLRVPNNSRPPNEQLDKKITTYVEMTKNKLRNVEKIVQCNYNKKNNIRIELQESLHSLKKLINDKTIVICKSDKDRKIIVVNYEDYIEIMIKELESYDKVDLQIKDLEQWMNEKKKIAEAMTLELYYSDDIDTKLLYCATGYIQNKNGKICKITGDQAKYFKNLEPGYTYPLFKTHKLNVQQIESSDIKDIPVRLVQSAGNSYLGRITALLETILKPISQSYCDKGVSEFCKDSEHYLRDLMKWKNESHQSNKQDHFRIIAADVKSLYPSLKRDLIKWLSKMLSKTVQIYKIRVNLL